MDQQNIYDSSENITANIMSNSTIDDPYVNKTYSFTVNRTSPGYDTDHRGSFENNERAVLFSFLMVVFLVGIIIYLCATMVACFCTENDRSNREERSPEIVLTIADVAQHLQETLSEEQLYTLLERVLIKQDVCFDVVKKDIECGQCIDDPCTICLEVYRDGSEAVRGKLCSHIFHKECLLRWMTSKQSLASFRCPYCREPIITQNELVNMTLIAFKDGFFTSLPVTKQMEIIGPVTELDRR